MIRTFLIKKIPGRIIIKLIRFVGLWINLEPPVNGVLYVYYPRSIIMVKYIAYDNHCKFIFGYYVQYHEDCKIKNNMDKQTVSGICLGPTASFQGRYKYFH